MRFIFAMLLLIALTYGHEVKEEVPVVYGIFRQDCYDSLIVK